MRLEAEEEALEFRACLVRRWERVPRQRQYLVQQRCHLYGAAVSVVKMEGQEGC